MPLSVGEKLGPYGIVALIGAGGMGEVYRARDTRLNRDVAIKVLPEHLAEDAEALARFRSEAMAVAALAHPNILVLHDVGADREIHYAVTEFLEGETLRERLSRGPLAWRKVAEIGSAIAEGLAAAHSKGIVHQDIKPANIFLTADGRVKILDFGLAQMRSAPAPTDNTATLTQAVGTVMGTIGYMSPEQVRGENVTAASDIFSLGCVLYEMLTGQRAFSGKSAIETMAAILKDEPPPVADSGHSSSPELDRVIERCLAKNPAQRFHSAHDLAFALRSLSSSTGQPGPVAPQLLNRRVPMVTAIVALVLILAAAGFYFSRSRAGAKIDSLAVLPFVNTSGSPDADWLSDGITESLIDNLIQVPSLKVMSRNAVFRYKGKETDAREAARQLGVRAVLTGRIVEHAGQLSVSAELVDARDGSELWGGKYDRPMSDILAVQQDITSRISGMLRLKLSGEQMQKVASRMGTENPEAYQFYLKGKYFAGQFTKTGFEKGMDYFRQAVAADPNYARAYEGMSYAYQVADDALMPPAEVMPKAKEAALKAIDLDASLSEAPADLASVHLQYDYDWPAAKREFERAFELNPNSSFGHEFYGWLLVSTGDPANGIAEGRKALQLDPLSVEAAIVLAQNYYLLRRYGEAVDLLQKAKDQEPNYPLTYWVLGQVYLAQGRTKDAVASLERGRQVEPFDWTSEVLAAAYAAGGNRAPAETILNQLEARSKNAGYVPAYYLSFAYLALNDRERALSALEKDYEHRSPNMTYIKLDPGLDRLRDEPRFRALLAKMRLQ
jgi:serine/threonine-protein kinase